VIDDRDCAALTYLARQGAGRRQAEKAVVEELRAAVRHRRGLVADRKKAQQRLHDQLNVLCPGLSAPAGHGRSLPIETPTGQAVLACAVAFAWGLSLYSPSFAERNADLRARGMAPIQARVALARNACRLIYRMLVTQQPSDEAAYRRGRLSRGR
jgi:hypothetical protein